MKQIRIRISDLLDQHKGSLDTCKGCAICTEITKLRKQLIREPAVKYKHILEKRQDMTKSDLIFLVESGVPISVIRKAVGINNNDFAEMMKNYGLTKRENKNMALDITVDEFIQLHHIDGKSFGEIAEIKGFKKNALSNWKWLNKEKITDALQFVSLPEVTEKKPQHSKSAPLNGTKQAEYERLIKSLKEELTEADIQCKEKDVLIRQLNSTIEKYEHIDAACDDVESEIESLREELDLERKARKQAEENRKRNDLDYMNSLLKANSEIKALKELLRLYL